MDADDDEDERDRTYLDHPARLQTETTWFAAPGTVMIQH